MKNCIRLWVYLFSILAYAISSQAFAEERVYVTNNNLNGTVSVIDPATNTVVASIPVMSNPTRLVAAPDGTKVYVSNKESDTVSVIDTANNTVSTTVTVGDGPEHMVITSDGAALFVANGYAGTVSVVDTASNSVTGTITVESYPKFMAITPDDRWVYVSNKDSGTVSIIDVSAKSLLKTVSSGLSPNRVVAHPDGTRVYVSNYGATSVTDSSSVAVFETTNHSMVATIPIGTGLGPTSLGITPDGSKLYSANQTAGSVTVMDTATNTSIGTVSVGGSPWTVSASADWAIVPPAITNSAVMVDGGANILANITVGTGPYWGDLNGDFTRYYLTNPPDGTVSVIDTASRAAIATVPTDLNPWVLEVVDVPVVSGSSGLQITGVSPSSAQRGASTTVSLVGSGFESGATVAMTPRTAGITIDSVTYVSETSLQVTLTIAADALEGQRGFSVTNPTTGETVSLDKIFTVVP
ncbi:MAG: beta-propeller fold lactonase family protein [Methylosarcina sp.]